MKRFTILLLLTLTVAGCVDRITAFSPRRPYTEAHVQASGNRACLGCHRVAGQRYHRPDDDCINCHKLAYGGVR